MNDFDSVTGLDLATERASIAFEFKRDPLVAEETKVGTKLHELVRSDTNQAIGMISKKKGLLPYGELMDWTVNAFKKTEVPFKLKNSTITKHGGLFQQYVFDMPIETPDGSAMSPMILLRGSYTGKPAILDFGTYRFVCANGAIVGQTIEKASFSPAQIGELLRTEYADQLAIKFEKFKIVVEKYKTFSQTSLVDSLAIFLGNEKVPYPMKKAALRSLEELGFLSVDIEGRIKNENVDNYNTHVTMLREGTGWDLYNAMTDSSSHKPRSIGGIIFQSGVISQAFAV